MACAESVARTGLACGSHTQESAALRCAGAALLAGAVGPALSARAALGPLPSFATLDGSFGWKILDVGIIGLPTLFAATASQAQAAGYYGPDRLSEVRGYPGPAKFPARALDSDVAERLWIKSERLTGTSFFQQFDGAGAIHPRIYRGSPYLQ